MDTLEIAAGLVILVVASILVGCLGYGRKVFRGASLLGGLGCLAHSAWIIFGQLPCSGETKRAYDVAADAVELGAARYAQDVDYQSFVSSSILTACMAAALGVWLIVASWWLHPSKKDSKIPLDRGISSR